jgi:catalase
MMVEEGHIAGQDATPGTAPARNAAQHADQSVTTGPGGEVYQTTGGDTPVLTTQQGTPVADDQNLLKIGARGPTALEDFFRFPRI